MLPKVGGRKGPSRLSRCLADEDWEAAVVTATNSPQQAQKWSSRPGFFEGIKDANVLPLHEAAMAAHEAPPRVIQAIYQAHPDAVKSKESSYKRLPLHCACRRNAKPEALRILLDGYAEACLIPDSLGRVPLMYALSNGAEYPVVSLLLDYGPDAAQGFDARMWTPLHVACSMGATKQVIARLLEVYPQAVLMRTTKGSTPIRCLNKNCNDRQEIKTMLQKARDDIDNKGSGGAARSARGLGSTSENPGSSPLAPQVQQRKKGGDDNNDNNNRELHRTNSGGYPGLPAMPRVEDLVLC